ncbi:hypothetical protein VF21_07850 [Pseudogymnoascus sp. 05NY08]|nr:hypothetical protein VF21_07850 [Pseudogymnoascus sp. 05NY08]
MKGKNLPVIDGVNTAGTAMRETASLVEGNEGEKVVELMVALDFSLEETTNAVPITPQYFSAADWLPASPHDPNTKYSLPLVVEQRLADDFASHVAVDEGAQSVAAVCVEQHLGPPSLTLRFAALDISLNNETKTA